MFLVIISSEQKTLVYKTREKYEKKLLLCILCIFGVKCILTNQFFIIKFWLQCILTSHSLNIDFGSEY